MFIHCAPARMYTSKKTSRSVNCVRGYEGLDYFLTKAKARDSYIARLTGKPDQPRFTIISKWQLIGKSQYNGAAALMRPFIVRANEQLDPGQQLASSEHTTAPINHTRSSPRKHSQNGATTAERTSDCSLLLIYRLRKDERLSWPNWHTFIQIVS